MGRATSGVKGIELDKDDAVIGMVVVRREATLLVVSEKGYGKRSELSEYRVEKRGGKGIDHPEEDRKKPAGWWRSRRSFRTTS